MSALLTSSVLILVILLLRKLFRGKVGDGFLYALWLVVAVRLLMPVPEFFLEKVAGIENPWVESSASVMNLATELLSRWEEGMAGQRDAESGTGSDQLSETEQVKSSEVELEESSEKEQKGNLEEKSEQFPREGQGENSEAESKLLSREEQEGSSEEELEKKSDETPGNTDDSGMYEKNRGWQFRKFFPIPLVRIAMVVWLCGSLFFLWVQVLSERRFRRRLIEGREEVILCGQKAYKARGISTPLLFRSSGVSVDIYIPEEIAENESLVSHALLHENAHKRHGDIWWGYLRNLLLAAYWFHPLVWVAAVCSKRDCEFACDSSVIGPMSREERISYGNSLLSLVQAGGEGSTFLTVTLMSVRKSELKKRICLVKRGRRRGIGATVLMTAMISGAMICTFTDARAVEYQETGEQGQETKEDPLESSSDASIEKPSEPAVSAEPKDVLKPAMTTLPQTSPQLTMEKLLKSYNKGELFRWGIKDIMIYENASEITDPVWGHKYRDFCISIPYQGIDYQIFMCYYNKKLDTVSIENMETGEDKTIYTIGDEEAYDGRIVSLERFLHHDNALDEEISYTLPEKLLETKDNYNLGCAKRIGRLFCREEQEKYGIFGTKVKGIEIPLWNSTGGLIEAKIDYIKEDKMVDMRAKVESPHSAVKEFPGGRLQRIEGGEDIISLQGLVCTENIENYGLFWNSQTEARDLSKKHIKETVSGRKLWIICVLDKKNVGEREPVGYVFFFDAEIYTKKQMVAFAKSIHLK